MVQYTNQYKDKFKFLTSESGKINTMRSQVNSMLNRILPNRILSKANIFNLTLDVIQDISNVNLFYVEDSLNENNINTAQKDASVYGLARLSGYNAVRPISSRGTLKISLKQGIQALTPQLILKDIVLVCDNNSLKYVSNIKNDIVKINTSTDNVFIEFIEGDKKEQSFVCDGSNLFTINLDDNEPIENYEVSVLVNGVVYDKYDSLYDMGVTTKGYLLKNGIGNQVDIVFGDGVHGVKPLDGEVVTVSYLTTNGELGNISNDVTFSVDDGFYDVNGESIDVSNYIEITVDSGFSLGSNGEDIETTRNMSGYNSRSLVFARPENMKAYLSRLSILSHIDVYTDEEDDKIFNIIALNNIYDNIEKYSDYLTLDTSDILLSDKVKNEIKEMLNNSRRQLTSSEIVFKDAEFKKYAMFIYIDADVRNKIELKQKIEDEVCRIFLENTLLDVDMSSNNSNIKKSAIIDALYNIDEISSLGIDIVSEDNERAKITGEYTTKNITYVSGVKKIEEIKVTVPDGDNPNIGFTELNDIHVTEKQQIPILGSGFDRYLSSDETMEIEKPIYIFYNNNNQYEEL